MGTYISRYCHFPQASSPLILVIENPYYLGKHRDQFYNIYIPIVIYISYLSHIKTSGISCGQGIEEYLWVNRRNNRCLVKPDKEFLEKIKLLDPGEVNSVQVKFDTPAEYGFL